MVLGECIMDVPPGPEVRKAFLGRSECAQETIQAFTSKHDPASRSLVNAFYCLRKFPTIPNLLTVFYHEWISNFIKCFSHLLK